MYRFVQTNPDLKEGEELREWFSSERKIGAESEKQTEKD
jgi:hypothetical protein